MPAGAKYNVGKAVSPFSAGGRRIFLIDEIGKSDSFPILFKQCNEKISGIHEIADHDMDVCKEITKVFCRMSKL